MSRRERNLLKRHARDIYRDQLYEHGAFGRGLGITIDQQPRPHNSLLGDMPYSDDTEEEEDDIETIIDSWKST